MNRRRIWIALSLGVVAISAFLSINHPGENKYQPREKAVQGIQGYFEYIASIRNNEITGDLSQAEVASVMREIDQLRRQMSKKAGPLTWNFSGPDNIGGRTRALLVDRNDNKMLYAGGVSGALYRSTNGGGSWYPITLQDDNFGIVSIAQTTDNSIYYGTGEGAFVTTGGSEEGTPGFDGMGIFKSTNGENFSSLSNTTNFGYISSLASHPTENVIFAGTQAALRYSTDGGETWDIARAGGCRDVKINKNGVLLASIGSAIYRSTDPTNEDSYELVSGFGPSQRMAIAWSESDPNYCYIVSCGSVTINGTPYGTALNGLYKSINAGASFEKVVEKASQYFAPLTNVGIQSQGTYNMCIGVHPRDKDRVFLGGVSFAEWTLTSGPKIVGNNFNGPFNPVGIHADKHVIIFDNSETVPIMYIGTDGGVSKTTNETLDNYADINIGYTTTQFYGLAASLDGRIIGGTQDNSTILITKQSFPRKQGTEVLGGDGFQTEISQRYTDIMFAESQYGNLRRSVNGGGSMSDIWDTRIKSQFTGTTPGVGFADFNAALELWETPEAIEKVKISGESDDIDSIYNYQSRLFMATRNGVWLCNNATANPFNPDAPSNDNIRWFKVANVNNVHYLVCNRDGNSLFIGSTSGAVYRLDGLNKANFDTTELVAYTAISDSLTLSNISNNLGGGSRTITSIAIDPSDDNRVVVTLGNYGNNSFVSITNNAMDAAPSWSSIQGALPRFPVYHALISADDPDVIVLGTEFGIYVTENGSSATPIWTQSIDGVDPNMPFPKIPVFELVQVQEKPWTGTTIYAATHGMGFWESSSLLSGIDPAQKIAKSRSEILAYPNPANNVLNLKTSIKGEYTLRVYSMSGMEVSHKKGISVGNIVIETKDLSNGNYFVEVQGTNNKAVSKFIVQH